jgi:hypothetical protein
VQIPQFRSFYRAKLSEEYNSIRFEVQTIFMEEGMRGCEPMYNKEIRAIDFALNFPYHNLRHALSYPRYRPKRTTERRGFCVALLSVTYNKSINIPNMAVRWISIPSCILESPDSNLNLEVFPWFPSVRRENIQLPLFLLFL